MAGKDQSNSLQQHLEKIVLGVAVLVLFIFLAVWGFSSSEVKLGGQDVPLNEVYSKAAARAQQAKDAADKERYVAPALPDYIGDIRKELDNPISSGLLASWPAVYPAMPQNPIQTRPNFPILPAVTHDQGITTRTAKGIELASLAPPPPSAPIVSIQRELIYRDPEPIEAMVAHVAGVYPANKLLADWQQKLQASGIQANFVPVAVQAERQDRLNDGSWSAAKPVAMFYYDASTKNLANIETLLQAVMKSLPEYDGMPQTQANVRQIVQQLSSEASVTQILEPDFGYIYWPTRMWNSWRKNLPDNDVSKAARASGIVDRPTGFGGPAASAAPAAPVAPVPTPARTPSGFIEPPNMGPGGPTIVRSDEDRNPRPSTPSVRTAPTPAPATPTPVVPTNEPSVPPVPVLRQQLQNGEVLAWFHDMTGLEPKKEYRWRYRLVLVNPLLTYDGPGQAKNLKEARQSFVQTEWSNWSSPVAAPNVIEMFVAGQFSVLKKAKIAVYTQRMGQTLEASFMVSAGEAIGGKQTIPVYNPLTGERDHKSVDFTTGGMVLSVDFNKEAIRDGAIRNTVEVLYVDGEGRLHRAIQATDMSKDSPTLKRYLQLRQEATR